MITIRDGYVGHFLHEGVIQIKEPGFYKVEANVDMKEPIPVNTNQDVLTQLDFRTKDGVAMSVKASMFWYVRG